MVRAGRSRIGIESDEAPKLEMRDQQQKAGSERFSADGVHALLLTIVLTAAILYALLSFFPADFSTIARAEFSTDEGAQEMPGTGVDFERLTNQEFIRTLNKRVLSRLTEAESTGFHESDGEAVGRLFPWGLSMWRRFSIELRWESARNALLLDARSNVEALSLRGSELALDELSALINLQIERDLETRLSSLDREIFELRARASSLKGEIEDFEKTHQQALGSNLSQVARVHARFHDLNARIGRLQTMLGRLQEVSSAREFSEIGPLSDLVPDGHPALELEERLLALGPEGARPIESEAAWASDPQTHELLTQLTRHLRQLRNDMIEERQRQLVILSEFRTGPEVTRRLNRLNRRLVEKLEQLDELELSRAALNRSLREIPDAFATGQILSAAGPEALFSPLQRSVMAVAGGLLAAFLMHLAAGARAGQRKP